MHQAATRAPCRERALRCREVCSRIGMSRTHLYRLVGRGLFPEPVRITERVSVWREADVDNWLRLMFLPAAAESTEVDNG